VTYKELEKILEGLQKGQQFSETHVVQSQGVITDEGPANARALTAKLAGMKPPPGTEAGGGSRYSNITPPKLPPEKRPPVPGSPEAAEGKPKVSHPILAQLEGMDDDQLREVVNRMHGKKPTLGRRDPLASKPRQELMRLAASAFGVPPPPQPPAPPAAASPPPPDPPPHGPGKHPNITPPQQPARPQGPPPTTTEASKPPEIPGMPKPREMQGAPPVAAEQHAQVEHNRLIDALRRLTESIRREDKPRRTVKEDIRGLSWGERHSRLQETGNLLKPQEVAAATLKQKPSIRDVVVESERQEQRRRDHEEQRRRQRPRPIASRVLGRMVGNRVGQPAGAGAAGRAAGAAGGRAAAAGLGGAVGRIAAVATNPLTLLGAAAVGTAVALVKLPGIARRLGESLIQSQRQFARYNGAIAATVARLDYQKRLLDIRTARETAGSFSTLGQSTMSLREDTQWMRELTATLKNTLVAKLEDIGGAIARFGRDTMRLGDLADWIRDRLGEQRQHQALPAIRLLEALRQQARRPPFNQRPNAQNQRRGP